MTGWWKYWAAEIRKRSASILTRLPSCAGSAKALAGKSVSLPHPCWCCGCGAVSVCAAPRARARKRRSPQRPRRSTRRNLPRSRRRPKKASGCCRGLRQRICWKSNSRSFPARCATDPNATTYAALSAFASRNAKNETGARAALALGYYDLTRDKPDLALGWLRKAVGEKLLREYVLYWQAQASLALGQKEAALEQLQSILRDFPDSAMTEQTVTSLAQTALAIGKGEDALAALDAYPNTAPSPRCFCCARRRVKKSRRRKAEKPACRGRGLSGSLLPLSAERRSEGGGAENSGAAIRARRIFPRRADANADRARGGVLHRQALARGQHGIRRPASESCPAWITSAPTFASCSAKSNWEASSSC